MNRNHGWIIYSKKSIRPDPKDNAFDWMIEEAKKAGLNVEILFEEDIDLICDNEGLKILYQNKFKDIPTFVLLRSYCISIAKQLELLGVRTYNTSTALSNSLNKWYTHQLLTIKNIKMPKTLFTSNNSISYEKLSRQLGRKIIIKEIHGSKGEGVFLAESKEEFEYIIKNVKENILFQEYIETSCGRDIRVHVIGNRVVASVLRKSNKDFRSNYSQGGSAFSYDIDSCIEKIAVESTKALGLEIAGVDLLFGEEEILVCEVNGIPGFRTISATSKINIPREIFNYIKSTL
ncbi:gamma-F420-2:alpha-L-glutamate ligase [Caminicella sporogenes DSM 14501]|uniref:Gamma-F420-2:alpha-L-glutamate ligase n=1 Tax=Caminicella sporogenes DSM 14501 TaxID=1121266 RepID=A0A1M6T4L4_9FIRM|nr:RimK family alpha-L-glutamate ligase [Caminicella sporogenes]RKD25482.1 hypothetical protein BET04_11145 [Caminicella sporogenes]SHK51891.1 gamma-F420-2:alpha-L-glutamate ligase [Caminicella sporogenes DSM 14501]